MLCGRLGETVWFHVGVNKDFLMIILEVSWVLCTATFVLIGASLIITYPHSHTHIQIRQPRNGAACLLDFGGFGIGLLCEY